MNFSNLLVLYALMNSQGFNSLQNAVNQASNFSSQINQLTNMLSIMPTLMNTNQGNQSCGCPNNKYIDTLKDFINEFSKCNI